MLCVAAAMLCKEQGITVTGVCAVYELFVAQKVSDIPVMDVLILLIFQRFKPKSFNCRFEYQKWVEQCVD